MYILIGGGDESALPLAESLMADHEVALILPEKVGGTRIDRLDIEVLHAPMTSTDALRKGGVDRADYFVACSGSDEANLIACLSAKRLGASKTICFLFASDLQSQTDERRTLAEGLGIDVVVLPALQLARAMVRIVLTPGALDVAFFAGGRVRLQQHLVEENAPISKAAVKDLGLPREIVLVMAMRGGEMYIPKGNQYFAVGDKVTAMGTTESLKTFVSKFLRNPKAQATKPCATIVGGGAVGLAVAQGLEAAGWEIQVIELDGKRCETIAPLLKGIVHHGDGADLDLLEDEQVGEDSTLVAVTSSDEKNLLVSLLGKSLGVKRILTRVDVQANERLFEKVGIDVVLSARGAAIQKVHATIGHRGADLLAEVEHGDAEVLELEVPEGVSDTPLHAIRSDLFAIIGAILRDDDVVIPRGGDVIRAGDRLLVFCKRDQEPRVRAFFSGIRARSS